MEMVANELSPNPDKVILNCDTSANFLKFYLEKLRVACKRGENNKAPGSAYIPPEIIKTIVSNKPAYVLSVYYNLRIQRNDRQTSVAKEHNTEASPPGFRTICLLDVEGNLYENLLLGRPDAELTMQTVNAVNITKEIALELDFNRGPGVIYAPHTGCQVCF